MAAAFISFISPLKPNPAPPLCREINLRTFSRASLLRPSRSEPVTSSRTVLRLRPFAKGEFGGRMILFDRRLPSLIPLTAHEELNRSDIEVDKDSEVKIQEDETQEAWKQALDSFKMEAKKMKELSQEAYEVYSERANVILKETSEALKIQADKARHDFNIIAKEISQEGQIYLSTAAKNSPESIKDIVETFYSYPKGLKDGLPLRDFYCGIPYGAFLAIGGFFNFMLTGSIPAVRFGVILGSSLLALSISSLRSWRSGQSSELFLKGQAAIATIIFLWEWQLFSKNHSFSTFFMTLLSGAMVAFYVYRMVVGDGSEIPPSSDKTSEK